MSVEQSAGVSVEEKLRKAITWYRVPLMAIATVAVVGLMHEKAAFWYGLPVALLGELVQVWAASHLHKDKHLAISGPYSHTRNPMYIGRFLLGLGVFTMTGNPYLTAGYAILYAAYAQMRVSREESRLKQIFASDYEHYCGEVHRWLPGIEPYSRSESRGASWSQVCANNFQINLFGTLVVLLAIYLRIDRFPDAYWRLLGR